MRDCLPAPRPRARVILTSLCTRSDLDVHPRPGTPPIQYYDLVVGQTVDMLSIMHYRRHDQTRHSRVQLHTVLELTARILPMRQRDFA